MKVWLIKLLAGAEWKELIKDRNEAQAERDVWQNTVTKLEAEIAVLYGALSELNELPGAYPVVDAAMKEITRINETNE